jgi:UDP-glucose 4-epimerase
LAREIIRLTGSCSSIEFGPQRPGDLRHSTSDPRKLLAEGWRPRFDISAGLKSLSLAEAAMVKK